MKAILFDLDGTLIDSSEAVSYTHLISKFFENNLNISETARQLYVHRNTLVYRLERIEKAIGLDIRTFDAVSYTHLICLISYPRLSAWRQI